ncbi:hypothetical protein [Blastococcus litoris]|uniref:hypothetical protein n=1 Tax=Blastococcus litoris TaxID=2171622 RepID=UPI000E3058C0|nr:hypothetical protein [Blastococcus litoris]
MTPPSPAGSVLVQPQALAALAEELAGLASELADDVDRCRTAAGSVAAALDGDEGWEAGAVGTAWAALEQALSERASALAQTVSGAVRAYLEEDARIAGWMGRRREMPR